MKSNERVNNSNPDLSSLDRAALSGLATATIEALVAMGEYTALTDLTALASEAIGRAFPRPRAAAPSADTGTVPECDGTFELTMFAINEPTPGPQWEALFQATWAGYQAWYEAPDGRQRPTLVDAQAKLAAYMPELVPTYHRLVALTGQNATTARMLTMWDPPRFLPGCSQMVVAGPEQLLCRNYDYSPDLFEAVSYSSNFTRPVLGTSDCLWGLLDGMNDAGLVVSLAFGGEPGSGAGFGIPLVVRYILEVAETTAQARAVLSRVPVNMAYNLTIMDASGEQTTAFVAPDRQPEFTTACAATNHKGTTPTDPEHARKFRSVERRDHLDAISAKRVDAQELAAEFLSPALRSTNFTGAFGTVYTALYRPERGEVEYHWPDRVWRRAFNSPSESIDITLVGH